MQYRKIPTADKRTFKVKAGIWNWGDDLRHIREIIVAEENNQAVGVITYTENSVYGSEYIGVGVVSVHPDYQGRGCAKGMIDVLFDQAWLLGKGVRVSPYTPEGLIKIKPVFEKFSSKFKISLKH